jgi:hypothetical protein
MVTGIYIPQNEILPVQRVHLDRTAGLHYAVGRPVDAIVIDGPPMMMVVHAAWRHPRLPVNRRATQLCWLHNSILRMQVLIGGDAVLLGPPEDDGTPRDIPADFATFVLGAARFQLEHRTVEGPQWPVHRRTFGDYFSAAGYGVDLISAARGATQTQIVAEQESAS